MSESPYFTETVLEVHHWTDAYFSFTTTRDPGQRFENGQFVMIGLMTETADGRAKPLVRAYSVASANWDERLHFFSIKVQDGPLTSKLQHLKVGDSLLVSRKPTGTLLISDLHPGRNLFLLGTGTGLAPWLSVAQDPETYERFEKVIVCHGVRGAEDLAYREFFEDTLPNHEYLGDIVRDKLLYFPAVSREAFEYKGHDHHGRITDMLADGRMTQFLGLDALDPKHDRAMICGSPAMLQDFRDLLDARGFTAAPKIGTPGEYVFERAFVEK